MHRGRLGSLGFGVLALALALSPLAACSSATLGGSSFGSSQKQVANVPNLGNYTAESALAEARSHFRNNDFGYSAALYKRVAELTPNNPEAYVGLGASYDRLRRFDLADRVYDSLYKLSGGTAQYYNNLGYSHMLRGNLAEALKNFRKAEALAPDSVVIANNLQLLADASAGSRA